MVSQSQDINNLDSITVSDGMTVASGNLDITKGNLNMGVDALDLQALLKEAD